MASAHATTNGSYGGQEQHNTAAHESQYTENGNSNPMHEKEEVGWYFVERYYTTLSNKPEHLHLFYNKKSQYVYGEETERLPVLFGRQAIQKFITELGLQGSKVRVANVDSQGSDAENIVVQVIGEIFSSNSNVLKKFVQTFVLAKQDNGYFVLNDIFRSLKDAEEETEARPAEEEAPVAAVEEPVTKAETPKEEVVEEPKAAALNADVIDEKLESALASESATEAPTTNGNGVTAEVDAAEEAPVAATKPEAPVSPEVAEKEVEEEDSKVETPKEPSPTPAVAEVPKAKPAVPVQPAAPPKTMTWAARASAGANNAAAAPPKPTPAVPTKVATPAVQPRATPAPAVPAPQPSQATPSTSEPADKEWQTAGSDQKRQARPQSVSSPGHKDDTLGYVRNVSEKVTVDDLKNRLAGYGELVYFDVNRSKNCAFVEFATAAGYKNAADANPHVIAGENIILEQRRPKAAAYGGSGYNNNNNNNRGAMNNRGRGNYDQGRTGSQSGGRGGFSQRGRGGPGNAPRGTGRPAGQTTAA